MLSKRYTCGRPTKTGKPCGQRRYKEVPACNRHLYDHELAKPTPAPEPGSRHRYLESSKPECWSWPAPTADDRDRPLSRWQDGRCAICGAEEQLVLDHDHDTGWVRGGLCRSCNVTEGGGNPLPVFRRYRKWNPARMFDMWERYENPFEYFNQSVVRVASDGTIDLDRAVLRGYWGRPEDAWHITAMSEFLAARVAELVADAEDE